MRIMYLIITGLLWMSCMSAPAPEQADMANAATGSAIPALPARQAMTKNELMGQFEPASHPDFVAVNKPYTNKSGMYLRREAAEAFKKMHEAAQKDGINLTIISSTRTFNQQKNIWETKWSRLAPEFPEPAARALKILEYSSMPGSSRHHWGTDIDLNDLNNASFEGQGRENKVYTWLAAHAAEYGFGQPYSPKGENRPNGYNEEKWHWSYLPLAKTYLAEHRKTIVDADIQGFKGAETAVTIKICERYVGGINPACQ